MRKKSLLTKVIAMGAITTLFASTTAFAATAPTFSTKTIYLKGSPNYVYVTTTVSGLEPNDEVTYLAGDSANPVYINQYSVGNIEGDTYSFSYKTTRENVTGSTVKVAKSNSTFTDSAPAQAGTLPATDKFILTVNVDGAKSKDISFEACDVVDVKNITLTGVALGGRNLASATIDDAAVTAVVGSNGNIVVTLTNALTTLNANKEMTKTSATINITTVAPVAPTVSYSTGVKADSYEFSYTENEVPKKITGPMFAIYGNVTGTVNECGIAVCDTEDPKTATSGVEYYKASVTTGDFGVAVVDDAANKKDAYVRTYFKVGENITFGDDCKVVKFN